MNKQTPTELLYTETLQKAFNFFNTVLFNDSLQHCLITLQRRKNVAGYFCRNRFAKTANGEAVHELAMNPEFFSTKDTVEVLQTLAHEMTHVAEFQNGTSSRGGYHNQQWVKIMLEIGLFPVVHDENAKPNQLTGFKVSDRVIEGGKFEKAVNELLADGFELNFCDFGRYEKDSKPESADTVSGEIGEGEAVKPEENKQTRVKFTCKSCSSSCWGKPSLDLICGECSSFTNGEIVIYKFERVEGKKRQNLREKV